MLINYLEAQNISIYKCSKETKIPYTTLRELCMNITPIEKNNSAVLKKLSDYFSISMDIMYSICQIVPFRQFSIFRSQVQHDVKRDEIKFVLNTVSSHEIDAYYACKMYAEAFYLLAMVDLLSDKYNVKKLTAYDNLRTKKLASPLYPQDIVLKARLNEDSDIFGKTLAECNPYFLKYNIVEGKF